MTAFTDWLEKKIPADMRVVVSPSNMAMDVVLRDSQTGLSARLGDYSSSGRATEIEGVAAIAAARLLDVRRDMREALEVNEKFRSPPVRGGASRLAGALLEGRGEKKLADLLEALS